MHRQRVPPKWAVMLYTATATPNCRPPVDASAYIHWCLVRQHLQSSCRFQLNGGSLSSHSLCWCCPFASSASPCRNIGARLLLCRCSICLSVHSCLFVCLTRCVCLCLCFVCQLFPFTLSLSHSPSISSSVHPLTLFLWQLFNLSCQKLTSLVFLHLSGLQACSPSNEQQLLILYF